LGAFVALASGCATGLTGEPRSVAGTSAGLFGGFVSDTGAEADEVAFWVEYGPTTAYGSESAHRTWPFAVEPNEPHTVLVEIAGLQRSTTYHYRFCAEDAQQTGGPGCGEDRTFTTANVDCGDVITQDLTLSRSLQCDTEPDLGLVIGADGVDINLNGNAVLGASDRPPRETSGTGIDNSGGYDDVTIRNGGVRHWSTALELDGASFNLVRNVDMSLGRGSVDINGGESNTFRSSVMTGTLFGSGLSATGTEALVVADSSGTQWGIGGSDARIVRNQIGSGSQFTNCLWVSGNRNRIANNTVLGCPEGSVVIHSGSHNEVVENEVSGAWVYIDGDIADGIRVDPFTSGTLLEGNLVHDNDDDGIDVRAAGTRLKYNTATGNGDFGIDAVAGVTDVGGNTASGNGNALQCRNVACGS
jgi:parallel beta-helix repeat protein